VFDNLKSVTACKLRVRRMSLVIYRGSISKESKKVRLFYKNVKVKSLAVFKEPGSLKSYQRQHLKLRSNDFHVIITIE
jgi:hypothetical protein